MRGARRTHKMIVSLRISPSSKKGMSVQHDNFQAILPIFRGLLGRSSVSMWLSAGILQFGRVLCRDAQV